MTTLIDTDDATHGSMDSDNLRAVDVRIDRDMFYVVLNDDREIGVPYAWYWRLAQASPRQRQNWRFIGEGHGIHWEGIDEDILVSGILKGKKNPNVPNM